MTGSQEIAAIKKINDEAEVSLTYDKILDGFVPTEPVDSNILEILGFKDRLFKTYELDSLLTFLGEHELTLCTLGGDDAYGLE